MSVFEEKPDEKYIENGSGSIVGVESLSPNKEENKEEDDDFSDVDASKVLRKIDYRLIPWVSWLYLLSNMDRGNIGNARIQGIVTDLNMTDQQFNLCLMIFFISYSFFEVPSNALLKKIHNQSVYVSSIVLFIGVVMTLMGLVRNFAGLFAARFFLGVAEAGLYPAIAFGLTLFYVKREMQSRQALFYCASSIAGAFSGLLAFAIGKMDGIGGYEGWRWLFIIEGLLTTLTAVASYWVLIPYPEKCKFLTERERAFISWRLKNDSNFDPEKQKRIFEDFSAKSSRAPPNYMKFNEKENDVHFKVAFIQLFKDWQIYFQVFLYWGIIAPLWGLSLFIPSVIYALGYTASDAQLMSIPPYVTAAIVAIAQAFLSDHVGLRSPFIFGNILLTMVGFTMCIIGEKFTIPKLIYAGIFLAGTGSVSLFPGVVSWASNNYANGKKRAIGMAFQIGLGNFCGAAASNFYKPGKFIIGHSIELGFSAFGFLNCMILFLGYKYCNERDLKRLQAGVYDDYTDEELYQMGDKSPFYKYRL